MMRTHQPVQARTEAFVDGTESRCATHRAPHSRQGGRTAGCLACTVHRSRLPRPPRSKPAGPKWSADQATGSQRRRRFESTEGTNE